VLFSPVFENEFEVGTDSCGFFQQLLIIFIKKEFKRIGGEHQIKNEIFVLRLVAVAAHDVSDLI